MAEQTFQNNDTLSTQRFDSYKMEPVNASDSVESMSQHFRYFGDEELFPFEEQSKISAWYSSSLCSVCCILPPQKNVNIETCQQLQQRESKPMANGSLHILIVRNIALYGSHINILHQRGQKDTSQGSMFSGVLTDFNKAVSQTFSM